MRIAQSSITAENIAILRAHESMRPEGQRIIFDPYAVYFLPDRLMSARDRNEQIDQVVSTWDSNYPGVCNSIIARTRFIDDCLQEAIASGIRQLVILGAGYDTRALRFESLKDGVVVFELDLPATQKIKLERIKIHIYIDPPDVRYIPIDLHADELGNKLFAYGYDAQLATLFVWEGVTYYIPASTVDHTLHFIANHSAHGSRILFDCFPPSVANGSTHLAEARALRDGLKKIGEEILFGIAPEHIGDFMETRGFTVLNQLTSSDYKEAYFKDVEGNRTVSDMFTFVQARVA
jgi:methyltransferase (TIGR00027 family)